MTVCCGWNKIFVLKSCSMKPSMLLFRKKYMCMILLVFSFSFLNDFDLSFCKIHSSSF